MSYAVPARILACPFLEPLVLWYRPEVEGEILLDELGIRFRADQEEERRRQTEAVCAQGARLIIGWLDGIRQGRRNQDRDAPAIPPWIVEQEIGHPNKDPDPYAGIGRCRTDAKAAARALGARRLLWRQAALGETLRLLRVELGSTQLAAALASLVPPEERPQPESAHQAMAAARRPVDALRAAIAEGERRAAEAAVRALGAWFDESLAREVLAACRLGGGHADRLAHPVNAALHDGLGEELEEIAAAPPEAFGGALAAAATAPFFAVRVAPRLLPRLGVPRDADLLWGASVAAAASGPDARRGAFLLVMHRMATARGAAAARAALRAILGLDPVAPLSLDDRLALLAEADRLRGASAWTVSSLLAEIGGDRHADAWMAMPAGKPSPTLLRSGIATPREVIAQ